MDFQHVITTTDAQAVVKLMQDPRASRSIITSIDQEIKELSGGLLASILSILIGLLIKHPILVLIGLVLLGEGT
jgi:hypothetical protein